MVYLSQYLYNRAEKIKKHRELILRFPQKKQVRILQSAGRLILSVAEYLPKKTEPCLFCHVCNTYRNCISLSGFPIIEYFLQPSDVEFFVFDPFLVKGLIRIFFVEIPPDRKGFFTIGGIERHPA